MQSSHEIFYIEEKYKLPKRYIELIDNNDENLDFKYDINNDDDTDNDTIIITTYRAIIELRESYNSLPAKMLSHIEDLAHKSKAINTKIKTGKRFTKKPAWDYTCIDKKCKRSFSEVQKCEIGGLVCLRQKAQNIVSQHSDDVDGDDENFIECKFGDWNDLISNKNVISIDKDTDKVTIDKEFITNESNKQTSKLLNTLPKNLSTLYSTKIQQFNNNYNRKSKSKSIKKSNRTSNSSITKNKSKNKSNIKSNRNKSNKKSNIKSNDKSTRKHKPKHKKNRRNIKHTDYNSGDSYDSNDKSNHNSNKNKHKHKSCNSKRKSKSKSKSKPKSKNKNYNSDSNNDSSDDSDSYSDHDTFNSGYDSSDYVANEIDQTKLDYIYTCNDEINKFNTFDRIKTYENIDNGKRYISLDAHKFNILDFITNNCWNNISDIAIDKPRQHINKINGIIADAATTNTENQITNKKQHQNKNKNTNDNKNKKKNTNKNKNKNKNDTETDEEEEESDSDVDCINKINSNNNNNNNNNVKNKNDNINNIIIDAFDSFDDDDDIIENDSEINFNNSNSIINNLVDRKKLFEIPKQLHPKLFAEILFSLPPDTTIRFLGETCDKVDCIQIKFADTPILPTKGKEDILDKSSGVEWKCKTANNKNCDCKSSSSNSTSNSNSNSNSNCNSSSNSNSNCNCNNNNNNNIDDQWSWLRQKWFDYLRYVWNSQESTDSPLTECKWIGNGCRCDFAHATFPAVKSMVCFVMNLMAYITNGANFGWTFKFPIHKIDFLALNFYSKFELGSHFDFSWLFERPIITLKVGGDGALAFDCKNDGRGHATSFEFALRVGTALALES